MELSGSHKSTRLTDDAVPLVQLVGVAKASVGVEVCEAGQPHSGVRVCEREGDAVRAGLRDRRPPFEVGVHRVRSLRATVHPGGRQGVLVVAPGDLQKHGHQRETHTHTHTYPHVGRSERSHETPKDEIFMVQTEIVVVSL